MDANGPTTGVSTLTVSGNNFGPIADSNQYVSIGGTRCTTSSWVAATSMRCEQPVGTGAANAVIVSIAAVVGTLLRSFTFDGAQGCCGFRRDDRCACGHQDAV